MQAEAAAILNAATDRSLVLMDDDELHTGRADTARSAIEISAAARAEPPDPVAHRALDGKCFPVDHPFWHTWFPPNGHRCRCGDTHYFVYRDGGGLLLAA